MEIIPGIDEKIAFQNFFWTKLLFMDYFEELSYGGVYRKN